MQFFPHNVPTSKVYGAVSASVALSSSLINNFAQTPIVVAQRVNTVSLALNISGARGTDGTSVAVYGPTGPDGDRGVTGFRGNGVYLLSSSWHNFDSQPCTPPTPPPSCWSVPFYTAYESNGNYICDFSNNPPYNPTTYYTTQNPAGPPPFGAGFPMYQDELCTVSASVNYVLGGYYFTDKVYKTSNTSNVSLELAVCNPGDDV